MKISNTCVCGLCVCAMRKRDSSGVDEIFACSGCITPRGRASNFAQSSVFSLTLCLEDHRNVLKTSVWSLLFIFTARSEGHTSKHIRGIIKASISNDLNNLYLGWTRGHRVHPQHIDFPRRQHLGVGLPVAVGAVLEKGGRFLLRRISFFFACKTSSFAFLYILNKCKSHTRAGDISIGCDDDDGGSLQRACIAYV